MTSSSGSGWYGKTSGTSNNIYGIVYGNSTYVAVGASGTIITSSDNGDTWTSRTSGTSVDLYKVTYGQ